MRRHFVLFLAVVGFALLALTACRGGAAEEATAEETEEATREATEEATSEATEEATSEATEEATAEETEEATGEATEEATAEATHEVPEEFEDLENPFAGDADAIAAGETIYQDNCALCHGETGMGDGPAAAALPDEPANFADCDHMAEEADGHLFYNIVEGLEDEGMPAWGERLTEDEMWQALSYIRSFCE